MCNKGTHYIVWKIGEVLGLDNFLFSLSTEFYLVVRVHMKWQLEFVSIFQCIHNDGYASTNSISNIHIYVRQS